MDETPTNVSDNDKFWYGVVRWLGDLQEYILKHHIKEPYWKSHNGRIRFLRDMDDSYLVNVERKMQREGQTNQVLYHHIGAELFARGIGKNGKKRAS